MYARGIRHASHSYIDVFLPTASHPPKPRASRFHILFSKTPSLPFSHRRRFSETHYSSFGNPLGFVIAAASAITYAYIITIWFDQAAERRGSTRIQSAQEAEEYAIMTGEPLPGRPGNLTAEEEVKLREFWTAVLKIFGVAGLSSRSEPSSPQQAHAVAISDLTGSEKKKRRSIFSRKHHEDTKEDSAADGEDKYGQTKEFHKVLENQTPEELRTAFWSMVKHDDPDALLLRFLRARKWNVQNALVMLVATMHWRWQEMRVDGDVVLRGEGGALKDSTGSDPSAKKEGSDFLAQLRMGKSFLHGTDKDGRPICLVRVRLHRAGEQTEASLERYTVYTIETARLLLTKNVDTAASNTLVIPSSHKNELMDETGYPVRHDGFLHGKHGLRTRSLHDQGLRSQLSGIAWRSSCSQGPMDLPIDMEDHQRLAGPSRRGQDSLHQNP